MLTLLFVRTSLKVARLFLIAIDWIDEKREGKKSMLLLAEGVGIFLEETPKLLFLGMVAFV